MIGKSTKLKLMKIFLVIESSTNPHIPTNVTWYRNLYESLIEMGHNVVLCPAERGRKALQTKNQQLKHAFSESVFSLFKNEHSKQPFDLAFFYVMEGMFEPWIIEEIRAKNVITTNFSCNNIHQFTLVKNISSLFDLNLFAEKDAEVKFKEIGVPCMWWPMASNPKYFYPINDVKRTIDASFTGAKYSSRFETIYQLLLNNINVHVYGPGWYDANSQFNYKMLLNDLRAAAIDLFLGTKAICLREYAFLQKKANKAFCHGIDAIHQNAIQAFPDHFHNAVSDDKMIQLYSESHVSLGFLEVFDNHNFAGKKLMHMHLRDFEAPMSGALYCTDYSDEVAEMFEPDKEILACKSIYEKIDKIHFYTKNIVAADLIRQAGLKRAKAEHTYKKRYELLFDKLDLA